MLDEARQPACCSCFFASVARGGILPPLFGAAIADLLPPLVSVIGDCGWPFWLGTVM
jgi:hypothetical protein